MKVLDNFRFLKWACTGHLMQTLLCVYVCQRVSVCVCVSVCVPWDY